MSSNTRANNAQPSMTGDDLRCMICTKATKFSDISHLLTHISSKQHLSNYFKIRVAADEDANAQSLLHRFDSWFERWNMGVLLRERLHQKEKKKAGARAAVRRPTATSTSRTGARRKPRASDSGPVTRPDLQNPARLSDRASLQANFNGVPIGLHYNPAASLQPLFPPVRGWPASDQHVKLEPEDESSEIGDYDNARVNVPSYSLHERAYHFNDDESALATSSLRSSTLLEEATEEEKDMTKLKGIIWPGMDLFDSATPEMQRKRNQKKAINVVAQLQAASLTVEADELIFNTVGEFLKLREITGDPSTIHSPLKGETTPEPDSPEIVKKRKKRGPPRRSREPLRELDENAPRARRIARRRKESYKKRGQLYSDEFDDELTYQMAKYRKKNGIRIHRDESGPEITFEQAAMPMSYLTSGFGYGSGLHKSVADGDHRPASRPVTPFANGLPPPPAHFRHNGSHDGAMNQHSPAYDLSAFGQLTNFLQPSVFPSMSAAGMSQSHASLANLPSFQPSFAHDSNLGAASLNPAGVSGFGQTLPNWDVFNSTTGNAERFAPSHPFPAFGGFDLENADINPLFLHSDQGFPTEVEQPPVSNAVVIKHEEDHVIKQEEDHDKESIADTISLASDQK